MQGPASEPGMMPSPFSMGMALRQPKHNWVRSLPHQGVVAQGC